MTATPPPLPTSYLKVWNRHWSQRLNITAHWLDHLSQSLKSQLEWLHQFFKDPGYWSGQGSNLRPSARQTGALPTELTGRWNISGAHKLEQATPAQSLYNAFSQTSLFLGDAVGHQPKANPRPGKYLTHSRSQITRAVAAIDRCLFLILSII